MKRGVNGPPNARHLNRFSRYLSTTGPITASRQERPIVQSCKTLDDFLPGFTPSWRHLISVRSVVRIYPGPLGQKRIADAVGPSDALSGIAALHLDRSPSSAAAPNALHFGGERLCGFTGTVFGPRFG